MSFSKEDKALTKTYTSSKIRFTEDSDGIFKDKLQKGRTGHFTKKIRET